MDDAVRRAGLTKNVDVDVDLPIAAGADDQRARLPHRCVEVTGLAAEDRLGPGPEAAQPSSSNL